MYKICVFSYAKDMKRSNKITAFYVLCSVSLFLILLVGGGYGIYVSVGMNFLNNMMSNVANVAEGDVQNVATVDETNVNASFSGIIILSAILIIISVFYMISLIKQLVFFKQFKIIRESGLEHLIEDKVKSKSAVIFFACLINVLSLLAGIAGIFVNISSLAGAAMSWVLYIVDGLVAVLSVMSLVLLTKKVKGDKPDKNVKNKKNSKDDFDNYQKIETNKKLDDTEIFLASESDNVDNIEYVLLKLKNMKECKVISNDEYDYLREKMTGLPKKKTMKKSKSKTKSSL